MPDEYNSSLFTYLTLVFLLVLGFILILLVVFGVITSPQTQSQIADEFLQKLNQQLGFGQTYAYTEPVDNTVYDRSECLLYNTFSIQNEIVDLLTPIGTFTNNPYACKDGYTMALSKNYQICEASICIGRDGREYVKGEQQIFYSTCGNLESCTNFRSVVAFNYYIVEDRIGDNSYCLAADNTIADSEFGVINCLEASESPSLQQDIYVLVESTPAYPGSSFLLSRLRIPNKDRCLFFETTGENKEPTGNVYTSSCSQTANTGYTWLYHEDIENIPSGFITYSGNLTEEDFSDPRNLIENSGQLAGDYNYLRVVPGLCSAENPCTKTQIVPLTSWVNFV